MRILVTGAAGMLGHDVLRAGERAGHELIAVDLPELDITDERAASELLAGLLGEPDGLDGVINCAAWTDVDGAEEKVDQARAVNALGAGVLVLGLGVTVVAASALLERSPGVARRFSVAGIPWVPLLSWADIGIDPL